AMRLADLFAQQVSRNCRSRGYEYFVSGAVRDLAVQDGAIVATVVGSEGYDVTLTYDRGVVRATCRCPFFDDRREICKHIWATILAAESKGLPLIPPGPSSSQAFLDVAEPAFDDVDLDDEFVRSFAAGSWVQRTRAAAPQPLPRSRPRPGPPPPWRQLLDAVAPAEAAPPTGRRARLAPG